MSEHLYLLKSSPETEEMILKIRNLIESGENANIELALQILQGGGVPPKMQTYLTVLGVWFNNLSALSLCREYFGEEFTEFLEDAQNRYYIADSEREMTNFLTELSNNSRLEINDLANLTFRLTQKGAAFCMQHLTQPIKSILESLVKDDTLYLYDFGLKTIPEEIGEFPNLTHLYLNNNHFTHFPKSLVKLKNLKYLYYEQSPVEKGEIRKLTKIIPRVIAQKYFDEGMQFYYSQKNGRAKAKFEKATKIYPDFAESWNWKGYMYRFLDDDINARICYEKSLELDSSDAFTWANLLEALCSLKEYAKTLEICAEILAKLPQLNQKTRQDEANIWFIKGLAHFWRKEYPASIDANDKAISINSYVGAWYNKACSYSKQGLKTEMLQCLETAIRMDYDYLAMAEKDKDLDFDDFYEDEDFIKLKNKFKS